MLKWEEVSRVSDKIITVIKYGKKLLKFILLFYHPVNQLSSIRVEVGSISISLSTQNLVSTEGSVDLVFWSDF